MIACAKCGATNAGGLSACARCGAPLTEGAESPLMQEKRDREVLRDLDEADRLRRRRRAHAVTGAMASRR